MGAALLLCECASWNFTWDESVGSYQTGWNAEFAAAARA